jgi:hypothetical protein
VTVSNPSRHPGNRILKSTIAGLALTLAVWAPASAATPAQGRITKGDVTSAFQARTTGGYLNLLRGRTIAAPVRGLRDGRISSFGDSLHCSRDWHYLGVTLLAPDGRASGRAFLATASIAFSIDGRPVTPTTRTAIKPFVGTGIRGQIGVSVGTLIAPGSLANGEHTLETKIAGPGLAIETLLVTFTLSPDFCGSTAT